MISHGHNNQFYLHEEKVSLNYTVLRVSLKLYLHKLFSEVHRFADSEKHKNFTVP